MKNPRPKRLDQKFTPHADLGYSRGDHDPIYRSKQAAQLVRQLEADVALARVANQDPGLSRVMASVDLAASHDPRGKARNAKCPCGCGRKAKRCKNA